MKLTASPAGQLPLAAFGNASTTEETHSTAMRVDTRSFIVTAWLVCPYSEQYPVVVGTLLRTKVRVAAHARSEKARASWWGKKSKIAAAAYHKFHSLSLVTRRKSHIVLKLPLPHHAFRQWLKLETLGHQKLRPSSAPVGRGLH